MRYAVIMAGGSGTRLWPLSQHGTPKQLLEIFDGKSLLRLAYERAAQMLAPERILICTGQAYIDQVARQLPEVPHANLLGEPTGRDSLNAAAWPAAVLHRADPDAVVAVLTADQIIEPIDAFLASLETAFQVAETDPRALVTFGVVPTTPHTGYGYLERGADVDGFTNVSEVSEFKEKPDADTAARYLASGRYWWNAGMFVWRAATFLDALETLVPATYAQLAELAADPSKLDDIYPKLFKTSVDYAILEPVSHGAVDAHVVAVGLDISWADVGSFAALKEQFDETTDDTAARGNAVWLDSSGNLLINTDGDHSVIAVAGLHDHVVVRTPTATLVAPLAMSQQIKDLAGWVADQVNPDLA